MPDSTNQKSSTHRTAATCAIVALLYCALWFTHYGQTPLGQSPALDNRQTLELAATIAYGDLPQEPFHRAPLYPLILSLFLQIGLPFETLSIAARLLNALALAITSAASALAAAKIWKNSSAAWVAGLSIALNPVLIFRRRRLRHTSRHQLLRDLSPDFSFVARRPLAPKSHHHRLAFDSRGCAAITPPTTRTHLASRCHRNDSKRAPTNAPDEQHSDHCQLPNARPSQPARLRRVSNHTVARGPIICGQETNQRPTAESTRRRSESPSKTATTTPPNSSQSPSTKKKLAIHRPIPSRR